MITTVNGPWWQLRLLARNLLNEYRERTSFQPVQRAQVSQGYLITKRRPKALCLCNRDWCPLSQNRHCILYTLIHALSMHQRYKYGQAFHPPPCQLRHLIRVPYTHTTQSHVVLRPGLTGILAFPQSIGALRQYDEIDCKVSHSHCINL